MPSSGRVGMCGDAEMGEGSFALALDDLDLQELLGGGCLPSEAMPQKDSHDGALTHSAL